MFSLAVRERCCSVFGAPVSSGVAMAAACCRSIEEYAKKTFPGVQVEPCATVCAISSAATTTTAERVANYRML